MYKHQLLKNIEDNIEYLKGQEKSGLDEIKEKQFLFMRHMKTLIRDAQCFFLGHGHEFLNTTNTPQFENVETFSYQMANRMPYDLCLLELIICPSNGDTTKMAILVGSTEDEGAEDEYKLLIVPWLFIKEHNEWQPTDSIINVFVDLSQKSVSEYTIRPVFKEFSDEEFKDRLYNTMTAKCMEIVNNFILILSCKNIEKKEVIPPVKLQKKRAKKGRMPLFSYYTLNISQASTNAKNKNNEPGNLWTNRAHLCRGHIKRYTEEKPLFGRFVGNVWCPPHARGNVSDGIIQKDYTVTR